MYNSEGDEIAQLEYSESHDNVSAKLPFSIQHPPLSYDEDVKRRFTSSIVICKVMHDSRIVSFTRYLSFTSAIYLLSYLQTLPFFSALVMKASSTHKTN